MTWLRPLVIAIISTACSIAWAGEEPLAIVDGEPIYIGDLRKTSEWLKLERRIDEIRADVLHGAIAERLLANKAEEKGLTVEELIEGEVFATLGEPDQEQITDYYKVHEDRINQPLEEVSASISKLLIERSKRQLLEVYSLDLRAEANVELFVSRPRWEPELTSARTRGRVDAPVTIVEYSDFECSYCRRVQPAIRQIEAVYGDKILWVFKDLPLTKIHPEALRAAQAGRCAGEQNSFWEFRHALFERDELSPETYVSVGKGLGLDTGGLQECIDSGMYEPMVREDMSEAQQFGITGTPTLLINGIVMRGFRTFESYRRLIDRELRIPSR